MRKQLIIMGAIAVVVVALGFGLFKSEQNNSAQPKNSQAASYASADTHNTGNPNAKVNLVEFGDYQCPACGALHPIVKQALKDYQNNPNFNFTFRNFPLASIHQNAMIAALAAETAGAHGKFWEMHDMLYENQQEWSESQNALDIFVGYAQKIGLDPNTFKSEVASNKYQNKVNTDLDEATKLQLDHTPTLFLNGTELPGIPNYAELKSQIDAQLNK